MSSVSGKGRSENAQHDETVRRMREEYKKREAELIKRHNEELNNVSGASQSEIDKLKAEHAERMSEVKSSTNEAISRRDSKYQKEIEDMKRMQTKQYERMVRENDKNIKAQRDASEGEINQNKKSSTGRTEDLRQKYQSSVEEQQSRMSESLANVREEQAKAIENTRSKFNEKHENEVNDLQKNFQEDITALKNELRTTRNNSSQRLKGQEIRHMQDKYRQSSGYMEETQRREEAHNEVAGVNRQAFDQSLDSLREKTLAANESSKEGYNNSIGNLRKEVDERMDDREGRLSNQLTNEKAQNIRDEEALKRQFKQRVDNLTNEYQKKYELLENARKDTVIEANKTNAKDAQKLRSQNDGAMRLNSTYYQQQLDQEGLKSRQEIGRLNNQLDLRTNFEKANAEARVKNVRDQSYEQEMRLKNKYVENLDIIAKTKDEEARQDRMSLIKQKDDAVLGVMSEAGKRDVESQQRVTDMVSGYEKKLSNMNDQFLKEKRLRDNREKQIVDSLKKGSDMEKEALRGQYEEVNRQANAQHEKEIREITRRHKEQIDNLMSNIKKS